MSKRLELDRVTSIAVIIAALCVAVAAVDRIWTRATPEATPPSPEERGLEYIDASLWEEIVEVGVRSGPQDASVEIVEFVDLECPFCRRSHTSFEEAREEFGDDLAYIFVHYPLTTHRFSRIAATGAECALDQGRFSEFVSSAFAAQDSLGLLAWEEVARRAGVADIDQFSVCLRSPEEPPAIEAGRRLGDRIGILATPTVMINRWRLARPPYENAIEVIRDILDQRGPYTPVEDA